MEFKNRSVRSIVDLHETELRRFVETWRRFAAAKAPMPDPRGDPSYESREHLVGHILRAARGYLVWTGDKVGRPVSDLAPIDPPEQAAPRSHEIAEQILVAWRRHLPALTDAEMGPAVHQSSWGEPYTVYQMLEHAVVHPMLHRLQLERILSGDLS